MNQSFSGMARHPAAALEQLLSFNRSSANVFCKMVVSPRLAIQLL